MMVGSFNSGTKRFDPSKVVTSEGAETLSRPSLDAGVTIPAENEDVARQRKAESTDVEESSRKSSNAAKYIGAAFLLVCAFFLFKAFGNMPFSAASDMNKTIEKYYSYVQKNDVDSAIQQFVSYKRPKIKRSWLASVARDTEYFKMDQIKTLHIDKENAKVLVYFYHKKHGNVEEYWDTTLTLVREAGEWRILTMTGNKLK